MGSTMPESTHPSLLERLRDTDDEAAWREFCSKYRPLLVRYARSRGLQTADCEDVAQLVLLSLSRALRGFRYDRGRGRFRDYLGRAVANAVATHLAAPERPVAVTDELLDSLTGEGPDGPSPTNGRHVDTLWEREWIRHHYRMAMIRIGRQFQRKSLAIFEELLRGETVAAIAQRHGTTQQAVHKIKQGIRDRAQTYIAEQIRDEEFPRP